MPRSAGEKRLFIGCFLALVTTSFGFILRASLMGTWAREFNFSQTQQGELFGVGLWPFAISIVLFSLVIDWIGYKTAMVFAFACHVASLVMTVGAHSYEGLYWANFVVALGNGAVEAFANPVVATQYRHDKVRWLNMLHAGWPAGLVVGGICAWLIAPIASWQAEMWLLLVPAIPYFLLLVVQRFPTNERVAASVPYRDMLREVGAIGAFITTYLAVAEVARSLFHATSPNLVGAIVAAAVAIALYAAVRSLGRPLLIALLLLMVPLATTELGVDSWVSDLMTPIMKGNGIWVLIYTSAVMMVLRFCAGPIVHRMSPLGLLAIASAVAAAGLWLLSGATTAGLIFAAATLYALGKSFFWPTMLGMVSEQCPKGGALALNVTGGVGMLGVGVIGAMLLGNMQDRSIDAALRAQAPRVHEAVMVDRTSLLGDYHAIDGDKLATLSEPDRATVAAVRDASKQRTLRRATVFPIGMLIAYLALLGWFRARGGYRIVAVDAHPAAAA